jgi:hypothetical protein
MSRFSARWVVAGAALLAGASLLPLPAFAGGDDSEVDDHDHGAPFFGEAKDVKGMKPVYGALIKAQVTGKLVTIMINTNDEGRFKLPGFGKDVDPANVAVTCSKDGYRTIEVLRRRLSSAADAPVEIECLLDRQN